MSSAWSQLEQMLTCAICLDKFKNPRLLPCQHSFCGDACMDGLVDYARRQIKCPECRAEHRIPYQGVQSLPLNVTLIRFLELHARITGEEPEPVPTFMEKCTICGEKVEGVARCAHCEKKVCPECKEAHLDLLRREIVRITGQSKRSVSKIREFIETLKKAEEKLAVNHKSVRREIEDSCTRLINDLQLKQKRLLEEVDSYVEQEQKTIDKLKVAVVDECEILDSNLAIAEEKLVSNKYQWNDFELTEVKDIYLKAMEFVRLFDPEIGDYTRKVRFTLIPEFETLRKRLCDLGELKFSESAQSLIANSFQYCNATGTLAIEICQAAALQQQQAQAERGAGGYGLAQSNSNTNLGALGALGGVGAGAGGMLELPNALMRSQSDHRLASQFQARMKQQQEAAKNGNGGPGALGGSSRYGRTGAGSGADYESDSLRSRYAPPGSRGSGAKDYTNDLLRDWPRPSDNDSDVSFGSSIHFKSAFMRRKEKERQQQQNLGAYGYDQDDDDLTSEASYGGGRNVRFYDQQLEQQQQAQAQAGKGPQQKVFDCKEVEHAPISGVPKIEECPQFQTRLHQLGAKAIVDKKNAEVEGKREKDLVESARQAMSKASERISRQMSGDEIEKQKQANKQQELQQQQQQQRREQESSPAPVGRDVTPSPETRASQASAQATSGAPESPASQTSAPIGTQNTGSTSTSPATPTSASAIPGGRRSLYGQAVAEKSKRQLSSAIRDAADYTTRRRSLLNSSHEDDATESTQATSAQQQQPSESVDQSGGSSSGGQQSGAGSSGSIRRRALRSSGRSMSKQSSIERQQSVEGASTPSTPATRRRRLLRGDSSQRQQSVDSITSTSSQQQTQSTSNFPKNSTLGSGGGGGDDQQRRQRQGDDDEEEITRRRGDEDESPPPVRSGVSQYTTSRNSNKSRDDDGDERESVKSPSASPMLRQSSASTRHLRSSTDRQATSTTTDEDDDDDDDYSKNTGTVRRAKLHAQRTGSSASSRSRATFNTTNDDSDEDDEPNEGGGNGSDEENSSARTGGKRNVGNRRSREFLPNAVNKLLDRSAQIRRDSQEQRTRGDSPQRSTGPRTSASESLQRSSYVSARPSGYSSSPGASGGGSSAIRQRLAYQRSQQSFRGDNDDDTTNSSHSIYTTASSQGGRRSSAEDEVAAGSHYSTSSTNTSASTRRPSGSSTDRTVISARDLDTDYTGRRDSGGGRYTSRRDSSGDTPSASGPTPGFQSRFLARSRTSAALSGLGGSGAGSTRSSREDYGSEHRSSLTGRGAGDTSDKDQDGASSRPSYLSSRDRFMQSASAMPASSTSSSSAQVGGATATTTSSSTSASPYTSARTSGAGIKTHSEYLRNKFARRDSSNSSTSSSNLLSRSRSSHAFMHDSHNLLDSVDQTHELDSDNELAAGAIVDSPANHGSRRASLLASASFDGPPPVRSPVYSPKGRMLFKLGSRGSEPGHFTWPRGVTVGYGSAGGREIVVADSSNHRVQIFDSTGKFLKEFGNYGSEPGEFDCLAGVAVNRVSKNYIVSDRYNHRIQIFDMSGKFVRSFGEMGREQGKFNLPWGVACDPSGTIYVCDKENHRVQVFDSDGTYLTRFGTNGTQAGQMQHPHYIAVGQTNRIVVTDTNNHRVQVFDSSGRLLKTIGKEGSLNGQFKFPRGVAVDEQGNIIVGDSGNNRLQIFNSEGAFIKAIGTWGSAEGEFKGIEGVAVDPCNNNIFVCDRENHRIQVF